jgi:phosphomannomutase
MSLMVSVSGIRGIVGVDLTPPVIMSYVSAFSRLMKIGRRKVLLGRDTRESGKIIERIVEGTLCSLGWDTINVGVATTPGILFATRKMNCSGGIAITASHNPLQWNALKLCNEKGLFFTEENISRLKKLVLKMPLSKQMWRTFDSLGSVILESSINELHAEEVLRHLDVDLIAERSFRVAVDPGDGAASIVDRLFLERLGCSVVSLHSIPEGFTVKKKFPRGTEPVPENLRQLSRFVSEQGADIGFAQDPDGDRLSIVSENGEAIGEEYSLVLAGEAFLRKKKTDISCNLSTSMMMNDLARRHGVKVKRTKIGEIHVTDSLLKHGLSFGGEGNGGIIAPEINPCRDSVVGMGLILELLAFTGKTVSQLVQSIPRYELMKEKISLPPGAETNLISRILQRVRNEYRGYSIDTLDGIKVYNDREWLHLRPSNTEPIIRIFAESSTKVRTAELIESGKAFIHELFREKQ